MCRRKVGAAKWYGIAVELWPLGVPWVLKISQCDFLSFFQAKYAQKHGKWCDWPVIRVSKTIRTVWLRREGSSQGNGGADAEGQSDFSLSCPTLAVLRNCDQYWPKVLIFPFPVLINHPLENSGWRHMPQKQPMWLLIGGGFFPI